MHILSWCLNCLKLALKSQDAFKITPPDPKVVLIWLGICLLMNKPRKVGALKFCSHVVMSQPYESKIQQLLIYKIGFAERSTSSLKQTKKSLFFKKPKTKTKIVHIKFNSKQIRHVGEIPNRTLHIRHQCRKTTVLSCHRCLINKFVENFKYRLEL